MGHRLFKVDQYVTTADGFTGYIYDTNSGAYQIAILEHDEDRSVSASEVTLWMPKAGDEVTNAVGEVGEFLHRYDERTSVVKWKNFPLPEIRLNASLEPVLAG